MNKLEDFKKGDLVTYVPPHAKGNILHPDCEHGVVSSVGIKFVFVKYDNGDCIMTTGDEPYTAQATNPKDLVLRKNLIVEKFFEKYIGAIIIAVLSAFFNPIYDGIEKEFIGSNLLLMVVCVVAWTLYCRIKK